jgi:hypothetical protein
MIHRKNHFVKYGYAYITATLFLGSLIGHWLFAWSAFVEEQNAHNQPVEVKNYIVEVSRDTLENWQSEFLQLIWQVAGLTYLFYLGSPQSKEGNDRLEEKVDEILKKVDTKEGEDTIKKLDQKYLRD